jgi:hypothetical protein
LKGKNMRDEEQRKKIGSQTCEEKKRARAMLVD